MAYGLDGAAHRARDGGLGNAPAEPVAEVVALPEQAPWRGDAKQMPVTENHDEADSSELLTFVNERVAPLAKTFAQLPVMQMRVRTAEGMITLVKAAPGATGGSKSAPAAKSAHAPKIQEGAPGRAYDTINAEAVGVFRPAPNIPEFGERVEDDRVLGFVEALKLRNPVRAGSPCYFVAQAVEDGQAVEFGEVLFVVERGDTPPQPEPGPIENEPNANFETPADEFDYAFEGFRQSADHGQALPPPTS
jgi:acetyl-CoA carboxylase biotin carboxyl carrier protein